MAGVNLPAGGVYLPETPVSEFPSAPTQREVGDRLFIDGRRLTLARLPDFW
jgi:hypothetical protein